MTIFEEISRVASSMKSKEAFVDLTCLMIFADNRSTLDEQDFLDRLIETLSPSSDILAHYQQTIMQKLGTPHFNVDTYLEDALAKLSSSRQRHVALRLMNELSHSGENIEESSLLRRVENSIG